MDKLWQEYLRLLKEFPQFYFRFNLEYNPLSGWRCHITPNFGPANPDREFWVKGEDEEDALTKAITFTRLEMYRYQRDRERGDAMRRIFMRSSYEKGPNNDR